MSEVTANFMKKFFEIYSSEMTPLEVAEKFGNYFFDNKINKLFDFKQDDTFNVSVLNKQTPLSFMTKRLILISDTIILTQYGEKRNLINRWEYPQVYPEDKLFYNTYLSCSNLHELGNWLIDCKDLLENGDIFFYPEVLQETDYYVEMAGEYGKREVVKSDLVDVIVNKRQISDILTTDPIKSKLLKPIAQIKLPYIDEVDLHLFSKITTDESESYLRFKNFFRQKLLELNDIEGDESYNHKIEILSIKMLRDLDSLNNDFKKIKSKRAFQLSGASIATATATLVAISSIAFGLLPELLSAGGGGFMFFKAFQDYFISASDIRNSPYYYLWLLTENN
jgi:hypothetical protein